MATVTFRIREVKTKNKNVPVKIRLSIARGQRFETGTGFTVIPKDWKKETQLPKQNSASNKKLHNNLKTLEAFIHDEVDSANANGTLIDGNWLQEKIDTCFNRIKKDDTGLLLNHFQYIIDNANTRKLKGGKIGLSKSRISSYETSKNIITEYQKKIKKQIHFVEINKAYVDKFTNWLINTKKYSKNYAGKQLDNLKTVCMDAQSMDIPTNPYVVKIEGFKENDEDRYIVTLSFDELQAIKEVELTKEAHKNARKWILIGCEIGQRGKDLLNISEENFRYKNGGVYIDLKQEKTKKEVTVRIPDPKIVEMIENEFPYKLSIQKLNDHIKEVCRIAGIDQPTKGKKFNKETKRKVLGTYPKYDLVSTHCFRRSFATNYYKNIPTPILIAITAHSKESLFRQYINQPEDKDANADLFAKFWEVMNKEKEPQLTVIKNAANQ